ncbi:NADP-dependent 3-hydroxy acid dehydrogenase YdfG [Salinibacter ruber]|uniref:SDR family oxidoreductase n=1 Tax=Salinibacter ruber TaxID=146919 RepID=UPI002167190B|nr:SDR family NAD(P)-dependent oxidoreductase [Salinibacter ruber]MCS3650851.1 NADP-dependent 3-hydroxy acid dehydrogenase YdfG [Salinibacter ruber]MCS3654105.1 NADP-dependent 3-hydroxy acid dehydrogenase YdfG [Salinibacter ruber]
MDLTDAVAVVTGASKGLGAHIARTLVHQGTTVCGLARSTDALQALRDDLGAAFVPVSCDVRNEDAVESAFETVDDEAGRLDVLVNNAGLGQFGPVDDLDTDAFDVQMDTNVRGVYLCTREAVPRMREQNEATGFGGHIVNIASIAGLLGNPNISAYNASKFAVRGFSEAVMKEVREDGIRVTCLYPGSVETNFFDVAGVDMTENPLDPDDVAATVQHVLEAPANHLISEVVMRPLRPHREE